MIFTGESAIPGTVDGGSKPDWRRLSTQFISFQQRRQTTRYTHAQENKYRVGPAHSQPYTPKNPFFIHAFTTHQYLCKKCTLDISMLLQHHTRHYTTQTSNIDRRTTKTQSNTHLESLGPVPELERLPAGPAIGSGESLARRPGRPGVAGLSRETNRVDQ